VSFPTQNYFLKTNVKSTPPFVKHMVENQENFHACGIIYVGLDTFSEHCGEKQVKFACTDAQTYRYLKLEVGSLV
jgi:uncharacterized protein YxeA